jgi:hypothetical protein
MTFNVTLKGQTFPESNLAYNISDAISDTDAVIGKAVCQDTTAANTVKLATDGSEIIGNILVCEDAKSQGEGVVVTVQSKWAIEVPFTGSVAVGDMVVGAGDGNVRKATGDEKGVRVWEVLANTVIVTL